MHELFGGLVGLVPYCAEPSMYRVRACDSDDKFTIQFSNYPNDFNTAVLDKIRLGFDRKSQRLEYVRLHSARTWGFSSFQEGLSNRHT